MIDDAPVLDDSMDIGKKTKKQVRDEVAVNVAQFQALLQKRDDERLAARADNPDVPSACSTRLPPARSEDPTPDWRGLWRRCFH